LLDLPCKLHAIINNGPGLLLVVEKLPWGNTLDITRNVEQAIKDLQPGLPDVKMDTTIFRPAGFVQLAIDHLTESIILGALLVLLVLGLFLYDWRSALISVITMPLSLVAAGLLIREGHQPDDAWAIVRTARGLDVPDTVEQRAWLEGVARP